MKTHFPSERSGFTRVDLMVVVVVLGLLLVVCIPAFGRAGMNSKGLRCLNNVRQLANAWRMYADDNRDRIVYAGAQYSGPPNANPNDLNNYAWCGAYMDNNPTNRTNWDLNYDITKRPLWPYVSRDASVYKCPEDQSSITNVVGKIVPRVLSMAMNLYLGGFGGSEWPSYVRVFLKTTDLTSIAPAKAFVFTDPRPDYINWSNFMVDMTGYYNSTMYSFVDMPGIFHDGGAAFSFADGHGEIHRWQDMRTMPPFNPGTVLPDGPSLSSPNNPDVAWLQEHATQPK